MTRLQTQHQRLYLPPDTAHAPGARSLVGADGRVRAAVLGLAQPADWALLSLVWRGVQQDLGLPAPGIAVSGGDALALWFSLAEPVTPAEAGAFLRGLCRRYLADVRDERVSAWPGAEDAIDPPGCPPFAAGPERWAAFVTPDLPAVFGDDPALDFPPSEDAQADLLSRLGCIQPHEWHAAADQLAAALAVEPAVAEAAPASLAPAPSHHHAALTGPYEDPRRFLRDVMNDSSVALVLRVEAAKALLS